MPNACSGESAEDRFLEQYWDIVTQIIASASIQTEIDSFDQPEWHALQPAV